MAKRRKSAPAAIAESGLFVIEGQGSIPIYIDGEMHRLPRATATEISPEDQDYLTQAGIAFEPAKSEK